VALNLSSVIPEATPLKLFVPDFVVALITPPAVFPIQPSTQGSTVNSCTVSGVKLITARAMPTPVLLTPSAGIAVLPAPTVNAQIESGYRLICADPRSSLPASPQHSGTVSARSRARCDCSKASKLPGSDRL
jgi:hypothetical protein